MQQTHRVRKVDATGTITTVAGTGTAGYSGDGGPATSAQLNTPYAVAVDGSNNLHIADASNHRIRKVNATGTITTVAGTGTSGYSGDGGAATTAQLNAPRGVAFDVAGNLYIGDSSNSRVRKVEAPITSATTTTTTTSTTTSTTTTSTTLPPPPLYPSNDCLGTPVFDGFAGDAYIKLRTDSVAGSTWVCVAADNGTMHVGGKVKVGASTPDNVAVDDDAGACDTNSASRVVNGDGFIGIIDYDVDVNLMPGSGVAWVCVEAVNTLDGATLVAKRVVLSASTPSGTGFEQDLTAPFAYVPAPNPGAVSSYCQANGGTRLLNADIGSAHVWAYRLAQNGNTKQTLCLRGQSGSTAGGVRLTVDGSGSQTVVTASQQDVSPSVFGTYCSIPVFGSTDPYVFLKAGAGGTSAYGCVGLLSFNKLVTVGANPGGGQTVVTHAEETS